MIEILPWHREPLGALLARRERLPHALLVHGQQGIGKVEFAKVVAQSLLCEAPEDGVACGACPACGWFHEGNHPDFRELIPEILSEEDSEGDATVETDAKDKKKSKEIKIEQVRDIADFMILSTHRDGFRVLLIHPAESMNLAAANALLKTLEEPPPRTVILLVSDQLGRLLATIRSRCQRILLPAPATEVAVKWLDSKGVKNPQEALALASGAPLDALAFSAVDYQAGRRAFVEVLASRDADYVAAAQSFEKSDLNHIVTWLQTWVSDLVLMNLTGDVRHHVDQRKSIGMLAATANLPKLLRFESALRQTRRHITHPLNARLLLEQLLISYQLAIR